MKLVIGRLGLKIDLYTKAVLTVIALSLSVIAARQAVSRANAQGYTMPVHVIVDQIGGSLASLPLAVRSQ
jgi:hypothetical protein